MKTIHIMQCAGLGDTFSLLARMPALRDAYPGCDIKFYLGGHGRIPSLSKQQIENNGYEAIVVKNFSYHNQIANVEKAIRASIKKDDIFIEASFCKEIFANEKPEFWNYDLAFPFDYTIREETDFILPEKAIAVNPLTKGGNSEDFETWIKRNRFWSRDSWKSLIKTLCNGGYHPVFCGYGDEDWGLYKELLNEGYDVYSIGNLSVDKVISILKRVDAGVFTNSWQWEITSRLGIPTISMYTNMNFFIQNHVPKSGLNTFWDTCYLETDVNAKFSSIYSILMQMIRHRSRPLHIEYDIAMITYNDESLIEDNLYDIKNNSNSKLHVLDGCSKDKTFDIVKNFCGKKHTYAQMEWMEDFSRQKNAAINLTRKDWIVWIDADEKYEPIFWAQLPWYISDAEINNTDCIAVPRINTILNLNEKELKDYAQQNGFQVNGPFNNWINYPDLQQRIFKRNCRYVGKLHETITNYSQQHNLVGVHCIHAKTKDKQTKSLELYQKLYSKRAKEVKEMITRQ